MKAANLEKLHTIQEAAEAIGVSAALIYGLCASRRIRHERHGLKRGRILIPQSAIDEYRRSRTVEVITPQSSGSVPVRQTLKNLRLS
jgi:excisionase family DNA binding protein